MTFEEAEKWHFNPFDLTKVWPQKDFPLKPVGRMVLDRNPRNYFAEVEQSAFSPANLVPGIEPSPDKMLQVGRCPRMSNKFMLSVSEVRSFMLKLPNSIACCIWSF